MSAILERVWYCNNVLQLVRVVQVKEVHQIFCLNPLGPIAPKGARLTLYSFVASHFAVPFPRELTLLLAVCWFSPSLKL